jgi:hypothetical protein
MIGVLPFSRITQQSGPRHIARQLCLIHNGAHSEELVRHAGVQLVNESVSRRRDARVIKESVIDTFLRRLKSLREFVRCVNKSLACATRYRHGKARLTGAAFAMVASILAGEWLHKSEGPTDQLHLKRGSLESTGLSRSKEGVGRQRLIHLGKADPSIIVSHELPLEEAPNVYKHLTIATKAGLRSSCIPTLLIHRRNGSRWPFCAAPYAGQGKQEVISLVRVAAACAVANCHHKT